MLSEKYSHMLVVDVVAVIFTSLLSMWESMQWDASQLQSLILNAFKRKIEIIRYKLVG